MSFIFEPLQLQSIQLKNRLVVSPMCQYSAIDGFANDWHLVHLGSRAVGGASMIIYEACAVSPEGRITPQDLGIWKDEHIEPLKRINDFVLQQKCIPALQLAHAGRKASCAPFWKGGDYLSREEGGWAVFGPSNIPFREGAIAPHELDDEGIQQVIQDFKEAAARSLKAGFKAIEIHAAHGYLIHEFLSPLSNQRTDLYGGSFDNRIRLLLEIIKSIQLVWPAEYPLLVRISCTDWTEGGWNLIESIKLSKLLKSINVDLIDCSSGGNIANANIPMAPGYQVDFAHEIKLEAAIKTGAVGLITNAKQADAIIESGKADLIMIGREFLRNPYFPLQAAAALDENVDWPLQYQRAK